jgi:hypothetical protein
MAETRNVPAFFIIPAAIVLFEGSHTLWIISMILNDVTLQQTRQLDEPVPKPGWFWNRLYKKAPVCRRARDRSGNPGANRGAVCEELERIARSGRRPDAPPFIRFLREAFAGGHAMPPVRRDTLNVSHAFPGAQSFLKNP